MKEYNLRCYSTIVFFIVWINQAYCGDNDYNVIHNDGSYEFGGDSPDSYHYAQANRKNVVRGEFGGRNPKTGDIDRTIYTAGPRGFRPRGKNVVRKYDLNQSGPRPVGSPDDPYYDPYEDPSYNFGFKTRTHTREENANRVGDVTGRYSYVDDVGERHNVEYIAGKRTGFHVKTPFPDSNPRAYGPLYFRGRGRPIPRGRTSIQRGLDGSYRFVSAGPDQRRTEVSDSTGHVRGSYTYLDEKGVQHSVHYIAGPETGYRVLKNVKGPHLPTVFPFGRPDIISPDFYDDYNKDIGDVGDIFGSSGSSASGEKPGGSGATKPGGSLGEGIDVGKDDFDKYGGGDSESPKPSGGGFDNYDDYDLFGEGNKPKPGSPTSTSRPVAGDANKGGGYPSSTTPAPTDFGESTTAGYGPTTSGYGGSSEKPNYGGVPSGYPSGEGAYPGDSGRPEKPLLEYGPPGFGKPTSGGKPGGYRPGGYDSNEVDDDFGLFGSPSGHGLRPPGKPGFGIQVGGGSSNGGSCQKCQGTIVTNVGDKTFTVPPGVSVRAHVQTIDLIPYESKIPSPSDQMRADMSNLRTEELNAEDDKIIDDKGETISTTEDITELTTKSTNISETNSTTS
ncbi:uncharacterized protein LOC123678432 isoform X3 [Harmonia axyridis]|uniref:uncharacterized protein LOC123678432 isoform X3 n=1 Tax=Harmonia axyridis TaxID=115357 RepID=UPI001E2780C2|nr:uncharacterized protein LOC123678432 isoform X3 [Harmonia axyridis]